MLEKKNFSMPWWRNFTWFGHCAYIFPLGLQWLLYRGRGHSRNINNVLFSFQDSKNLINICSNYYRNERVNELLLYFLNWLIYFNWRIISYCDDFCHTSIWIQYFGHLMWRADWLEKTLMLGGTEGRRRRGRHWDDVTDSMDMSLGELRELVLDREAWRADSWGRKESDTIEQLDWTELNCNILVVEALVFCLKIY